jgi:hypothetical protein
MRLLNIQVMTHIFSGNCPLCEIGAARIGQTQEPFWTVQLFGAGAQQQQVQGSAAGLLLLCNPLPSNMFVMIRPPGIDNGAFVVSPETVWYACVLLLFSASAVTDTGSKSFDCALVSTLETHDDPENGNYLY